MAVLGLRFCVRAFSSCGKRGPLFIAMRGPLTIAASLVEEHRLQTRRLSNCGSRAQLLRGMWDLPRPGLKPASPALAGRFSTTAPPGKPYPMSFIYLSFCSFMVSAILYLSLHMAVIVWLCFCWLELQIPLLTDTYLVFLIQIADRKMLIDPDPLFTPEHVNHRSLTSLCIDCIG